jgi:hypothetical protein
MKCALTLALGLIACLPRTAAAAPPAGCDAVSTPDQKIDEDTIRRTGATSNSSSACSNPITAPPANPAKFDRTCSITFQ